MPLESLKYTGETKFEVGNKIDVVNGHEICRKYIPKGNRTTTGPRDGNRTRKRSVPIAPLFAEHADTEQLAYHLDDIHPGDLVEITLKIHGTSGRTGYLPKFVGYENRFPLLERLANMKEPMAKGARKFHEYAVTHSTPAYDWGYVTGTRRVVLNDFEDGGFYGSNAFREPHAKFFEGKLNKGETVYYEIVGFTTDGAPIMPSVANSKISDKAFSKQYGKETVFSYGCDPEPGLLTKPQSACYVYRMTLTTEDGDVVEYTPAFMRYRCMQMGAKTVPVLWRGFIPDNIENAGEYVKNIAEQYYDGPDPIGKTHIREGVVIRLVDRPKFCAYKHKNFSFKCLSGIAADLAASDNEVSNYDADRLAEI